MTLPKPETMLVYASILEKPQYQVDPKTGKKYLLATGEIIEAACEALRACAAAPQAQEGEREVLIHECAAIADKYDDCGGAFIAQKIRDLLAVSRPTLCGGDK